MKMFHFLSFATALAIAVLVGCDSQKTTTKTGSGSDSGEHNHDDESHQHRHGVEGHTHEEGPHGGAIADWGGGKFHVEVTVDHDQKQATAYVLGGDEITAIPIDAKEITLAIKEPALVVILKPSPQDDDPEGKASRFIGGDENLGDAREYEGSLSSVVNGTPYSGNFKEDAHDH